MSGLVEKFALMRVRNGEDYLIAVYPTRADAEATAKRIQKRGEVLKIKVWKI